MQTASYIALTHQSALERNLAVVANNIANSSTTAYKNQSSLFRELLEPGQSTGFGRPRQTISYVRDIGTFRNPQQGNLASTGNSLDTAIDGNGFFAVDTPDGTRYTRNGKFQLDTGNRLVTAQGNPVLSDTGQEITIPRNTRTIQIGTDGGIRTENGAVAKLGVVTFDKPQSVIMAANGLYVADAEAKPAQDVQVRQGMIEESNIQTIVELTKMMGLQKAYTASQEIIEGEDNRIRTTIDKLSRSV